MRELVLHALAWQIDTLSEALVEAGALSISIEAARRDSDEEELLFSEPGDIPLERTWTHNRVVALLPDETDPAVLVAHVSQVLAAAEQDVTTIFQGWTCQDLPDVDWVRLTQAQFAPLFIGNRIWIVPSWHRNHPAVLGEASPGQAHADKQAIHIELDPGLAFGIGSHPSTYLCLEWLIENMTPNASVLDYGCGSGILAIAACKLGAKRVWAVDIEASAVTATQENACQNHVTLTAMLPEELGPGVSDIVVSNILANPLQVLAPMLCARVAKGGALVLSGILARQAEAVCSAYAPWVSLSVWKESEGWVCLYGRRLA